MTPAFSFKKSSLIIVRVSLYLYVIYSISVQCISVCNDITCTLALPSSAPVDPTLALTSTQDTQSGPQEVYLWLPLIVVVVFTGVMVTLILIGRKSESQNPQATGNCVHVALSTQ